MFFRRFYLDFRRYIYHKEQYNDMFIQVKIMAIQDDLIGRSGGCRDYHIIAG